MGIELYIYVIARSAARFKKTHSHVIASLWRGNLLALEQDLKPYTLHLKPYTLDLKNERRKQKYDNLYAKLKFM